MTTAQNMMALKKLDLCPASQRTAAVLGLAIRQLIRLGNHQAEPSATLVLLLKMYQRHGIPSDI
jgi:hypothetical protein